MGTSRHREGLSILCQSQQFAPHHASGHSNRTDCPSTRASFDCSIGQPVIANLNSLAGVGSEIVTSFRPLASLPFRARWIALITEFEWNHHFADIQKKGPFKRFQHRHEFSAETRNGASGTTVRDVIEYDPGFGGFGDLAQRLFIIPSLKQTFEYRQKMLEKLLC